MLYRLGSVLTPFVLGAVLAYLGDPLVDRLQQVRLSRTAAVLIVFMLLTLLGALLVLFLVPVMRQQVSALLGAVPAALVWFRTEMLPQIVDAEIFKTSVFSSESIYAAVSGQWQSFAGALMEIIKGITESSQVALTLLIYLFLVPIVTFYLLRDWDHIVERIHQLLPRRYEATIVSLVRECDSVLAAFLRGQFGVMLSLGAVYALGLWIVGVELALSLGMLAGLVSFVPYLGFFVGIGMTGLAAVAQFQDLLHLVYVVAVFTVGQLLEGYVLSPWLVGTRIGLHPVAVIFSVMAGGQLFGMVGVLIALPVAAVVLVLLRHSRDRYLASDFYTPQPHPPGHRPGRGIKKGRSEIRGGAVATGTDRGPNTRR